MNKPLKVLGKITNNGIRIEINNKKFDTQYSEEVWRKTPETLKKILRDNLVFGNTHWLPIIFNTDKVVYSTRFPLIESFLFRNQLYDILFSESVDRVKFMHYFKMFYNLEFEFNNQPTLFPTDFEKFKTTNENIAVLPFTFGKESLTTLCLCMELNIKPILVYVEEPVNKYEKSSKKKLLAKIKKELDISIHYVSNKAGLFREDAAFNIKPGTELGWGTQTTLLILQMMPFVYIHKASHILIGSEYSNNEYETKNGWKIFQSYDQTTFWSAQQNIISKILTQGNTEVKSTLQPLEEIQIFYILHHRYKSLAKYQFSCFANKPLYNNSQWCHHCYKCWRIFLFAVALGIDPYSIGFKTDVLAFPNIFDNYFGTRVTTGSQDELHFAFYLASIRQYSSPYVTRFNKEILQTLRPFSYYLDFFTRIKDGSNLPVQYKEKLIHIFKHEMKHMKISLTRIK